MKTRTLPAMKTKHAEITFIKDDSGSSSLNRNELTECFNTLIGHTARSVHDKDIEIAFVDGFKEWRKQQS